MKKGDVVKSKDDFHPFFRKGDKFIVIKINTEEGLMPVEALHFKTKQSYGFREFELEVVAE